MTHKYKVVLLVIEETSSEDSTLIKTELLSTDDIERAGKAYDLARALIDDHLEGMDK